MCPAVPTMMDFIGFEYMRQKHHCRFSSRHVCSVFRLCVWPLCFACVLPLCFSPLCTSVLSVVRALEFEVSALSTLRKPRRSRICFSPRSLLKLCGLCG